MSTHFLRSCPFVLFVSLSVSVHFVCDCTTRSHLSNTHSLTHSLTHSHLHMLPHTHSHLADLAFYFLAVTVRLAVVRSVAVTLTAVALATATAIARSV